MKNNFKNKRNNYSMKNVTVKALTGTHSDSKKYGLPFELQGHGESDHERGTIQIRYPLGDIFLSVATAIHEAGHPRQDELNNDLQHFPLGPDVAAEADAWQRGWERFTKANPEFLSKLEKKFQINRNEGKLKDFASFQALYFWIQTGVTKMIEAQRNIYNSTGRLPSQYNDADLAQFRNQSDRDNFVQRYELARIGELLDKDEFGRELTKTISFIINE